MNAVVRLPAVPDRDTRPPPCRVANWTPWAMPNPSLVGHADITFPGGWKICGVPIFRTKTGGFSAGVPNAPDLDRDGRIKTSADGKRVYRPLLQFETAAARERWNAAVLGALADAGISAPAEVTP